MSETTSEKKVIELKPQGFQTAGPTRDPEHLPIGYAPLIRNCWYVLAEIKDVGRELRGLQVCGEPLVYFRTEAGDPVVLDDRCAHRRFSLSKSKLVGDTVQCGYHGFKYDQTGKCVWAPGISVAPNFGIRKYPCAEVGPWLWVWMGNPEKADVSKIPYPKLDPTVNWRKVEGYKWNPGNYLFMIENFFDQAHLHFLHGETVSKLDQADTPQKSLDVGPDAVGWIKETDSVGAGLFAGLAGGDPTKLVRVVGMDKQYGVSLNYGIEDRYALEGDPDPLYPLHFHIFNAMTPKDLHSTHQFYQANVNFDIVHGLDWFRDFSSNVVFQQDADAFQSMQTAIESDFRTGIVEFGITTDRFGMKMRKMIKEWKEAEADDEFLSTKNCKSQGL